VLERHARGYAPFHAQFRVLFNSYYQQVGAQHPRPQRGLISRPTLAEVLAYRASVDERIAALLATPHDPEVAAWVELGLQHEQQHQELVPTDIKCVLSCNPLAPRYLATRAPATAFPVAHGWHACDGGLVDIGHAGEGFAFDNEAPRHRQYLRPYALGNRLVTQGEWADFIADDGYADPRWWLGAGWDWVRAQRIEAPLYWQRGVDGGWHDFTLHGRLPIDPNAPVTHVSYFEADAFARWAAVNLGGCAEARLPVEAEWEHAAATRAGSAIAEGNFVESRALHPLPVPRNAAGPMQLFGDVWEWTASAYAPYPGFRPWDGAVGEYNGKFMVNQYVLRGGSCATPASHIRATYRNFFPTDARWQFSGLRLARDLD